MAVLKKRYWAFVLYPESAPSDWTQQIIELGLPFCVSPLHDSDILPTGERKKPHYHVILCFSGPTTYNVVFSLTSRLNQPIPKAIESVAGYYRYLSHKDCPDKAQYDESLIQCFNGFNVRDYIEITKTEVLRIKMEVVALIREYSFTEYSDLCNYVLDNLSLEHFDIVSSNTIFFNSYLKSVKFGNS